MGIPPGFKYLKNLATYPRRSMRKTYIDNYGEDLENCFDVTDKALYKHRIFCLDCSDFDSCKGKFWRGCPKRAEALKIIGGGS